MKSLSLACVLYSFEKIITKLDKRLEKTHRQIKGQSVNRVRGGGSVCEPPAEVPAWSSNLQHQFHSQHCTLQHLQGMDLEQLRVVTILIMTLMT